MRKEEKTKLTYERILSAAMKNLERRAMTALP